MAEEKKSAQLPEGGSGETESQGSSPATQVVEKNQEDSHVKVDDGGQQTSSQTETRKASEFYENRLRQRRRVEELESSVKKLTEELGSLKVKSTVPVTPTIDPKDEEKLFWENPLIWTKKQMEEREKKIREEVRKEILEKDVPEYLSKSEQEKEYKRKEQEALELIFPKVSPDDKTTLDERILKDPIKVDKIMKILAETGLEGVSKTDPIKAAATVLKLYNLEAGTQTKKTNNNKIDKKLVGSVGSGVNSNAEGGRKMTLEELQSKKEALMLRLEKNPDLRYEDSFKNEWSSLKQELTNLHAELKAG